MEMLDPKLPEMIAEIEKGAEFALVLAPASNELNFHEARSIIRLIKTVGDDFQLAYHELYAGRAGSGHYGNAAKIAETARSASEAFANSHLYKSFHKKKGFRWVFAREIDVPVNMMI